MMVHDNIEHSQRVETKKDEGDEWIRCDER